MLTSSPATKATDVILQDAVQRDLPAARRLALLGLLWHERCLNREQLVARIERELGKGCFGKAAWKDNFYRDMRVVKQAFAAAGFDLAYSRSKSWRGYYLNGQPRLSNELRQMIENSSAEVDPLQLEVFGRLTAAERFRIGCNMSDSARNVVAYRIQQEEPAISLAEAYRKALARAYTK